MSPDGGDDFMRVPTPIPICKERQKDSQNMMKRLSEAKDEHDKEHNTPIFVMIQRQQSFGTAANTSFCRIPTQHVK